MIAASDHFCVVGPTRPTIFSNSESISKVCVKMVLIFRQSFQKHAHKKRSQSGKELRSDLILNPITEKRLKEILLSTIFL